MTFRSRLRLTIASAVALLALTPWSALAAYPDKPVKIVVAFAPGGAADMLARTVATHLSSKWGQTVLVENRPGAAGNVGADFVAKSAPDGYTLMMSAAGLIAVNPHLYPNLPYDSTRDFRGVIQLVNAPLVLVVNASTPIKNFGDYVKTVKSQPDKFSVANGGSGTAQHLGAAYLDMRANMKSLHVPYKGSAPATNDLLGGQVQAMLDNMVTQIPHIKSGRLRAIAVTSASRVAILPDVPTVAESGLPGFETGTWYGILAPARTPDEIVNKLYAEILTLVKSPTVSEAWAAQGLQPSGMGPHDYDEFMKQERRKAGEIVKAANVRLD